MQTIINFLNLFNNSYLIITFLILTAIGVALAYPTLKGEELSYVSTLISNILRYTNFTIIGILILKFIIK